MSENLKVSFNSPQCGWMSVGFSAGDDEFHTTTAHDPHPEALAEILTGLKEILESAVDTGFEVRWSRNPEAYDFRFVRNGSRLEFSVVEYPTFERTHDNAEPVFAYEGDAVQIAEAFHTTFRQLYEERDVDQFETNWHSEFPFDQYRALGETTKELSTLSP